MPGPIHGTDESKKAQVGFNRRFVHPVVDQSVVGHQHPEGRQSLQEVRTYPTVPEDTEPTGIWHILCRTLHDGIDDDVREGRPMADCDGGHVTVP